MAPKSDDHHHIAEAIFNREAAEVDQQEQERDQVRPFDERDLGELIEEQKTDRYGDDVGDDDDPDEGQGEGQMLGRVQQIRSGHDALNDEGAEQDRHRHAAGNAEGERGNQRAALFGIVRRAGTENAFDGAFAEAIFVRESSAPHGHRRATAPARRPCRE